MQILGTFHSRSWSLARPQRRSKLPAERLREVPHSSEQSPDASSTSTATTGESPLTSTRGTTAADATTGRADERWRRRADDAIPRAGGCATSTTRTVPTARSVRPTPAPTPFIPERHQVRAGAGRPVDPNEPCSRRGATVSATTTVRSARSALDLDYDGSGLRQLPYCTGDSQNPVREGSDTTCVKLFLRLRLRQLASSSATRCCRTAFFRQAARQLHGRDQGRQHRLRVPAGGAGAARRRPTRSRASAGRRAPGYARIFDALGARLHLLVLLLAVVRHLRGRRDVPGASDRMACIAWYGQDQAPLRFENVGRPRIPA